MPDSNAARWAERRAQTPVTQGYAYLNAGWIGALSLPVADAMRARIDLELTYGSTSRTAMDDRVVLNQRLRAGAARMLGADVEEIAITGNTTEGVNIAVNGLAIEPGDGVVTSNIEHPGGLIPAYYTRSRRGADLRFVHVAAEDGPGTMLEAFDRAIDDRTKLVIFSEISYSTGQLKPLAAITELAHSRGASVVIDGAQTAGHVPIDAHALGVDAYAMPSHKWLCGPSGLGLLYVRRDRIADFDPIKVGGRAAASFDYAGGSFVPQRDAITKFEVSTMSSPSLAGLAVAIDAYNDAGHQALWDRVRALNRYAETRFAAIDGVTVTSPTRDDTRTGLFLFRTNGVDAAALSAWLQAEGGIICRSVRQFESVRLSLHVYNVEEEIDRTAALVARAVAEGLPAEFLATFRAVSEA